MLKVKEIMFVTDHNVRYDNAYLDYIENLLKMGVTSVQLRDKISSYDEIILFGKKIKLLTKKYNAIFIVNDHVQIAIELDADGIHIGQSDGDVEKIKSILGHDKIIGLSVLCKDDIIRANNLPINYIGVGAIFPTDSKKDAVIWGLKGLLEAIEISKLPIIAIGGIDKNNVSLLGRVSGVAAISSLHQKNDVKETLLEIKKSLGI